MKILSGIKPVHGGECCYRGLVDNNVSNNVITYIITLSGEVPTPRHNKRLYIEGFTTSTSGGKAYRGKN